MAEWVMANWLWLLLGLGALWLVFRRGGMGCGMGGHGSHGSEGNGRQDVETRRSGPAEVDDVDRDAARHRRHGC